MRVLYVTGHYPPDFVSGATLLVERLARQLVSLGHDVAVLAGAIADPTLVDGEVRTEVRDGVTVHWLGTTTRVAQDTDANWLNPAATVAATNIIESFRPDVVHGHALQTLGAALFRAAAAAGGATVLTMHDFWWWCSRLFLVDRDLRVCPLAKGEDHCSCAIDDRWRRTRRTTLAHELDAVDLVLVPSAAMLRATIALGLDPTRVEVDENDIELAPAPPRSTTLGSPVRFLYVGGESPLKGCDVLLAAAARLPSQGGWQLTLRGVADPRRWWHRRRRPSDDLRFLPPYRREEAAAVFADADVLIVPSIARESSSIAAREGLASGLAVITSDCLGPLDVVADGVNGLVVPTGDVDALAGAMHALANDRQLLEMLRTTASRSPRWRTPREHARELVDRYERLLSERRAARS